MVLLLYLENAKVARMFSEGQAVELWLQLLSEDFIFA
jgi:hypothetical protein